LYVKIQSKDTLKTNSTMKKGVLFGLAAVVVGVVVYSLNKKGKLIIPFKPAAK
jgi:hypothetical protein